MVYALWYTYEEEGLKVRFSFCQGQDLMSFIGKLGVGVKVGEYLDPSFNHHSVRRRTVWCEYKFKVHLLLNTTPSTTPSHTTGQSQLKMHCWRSSYSHWEQFKRSLNPSWRSPNLRSKGRRVVGFEGRLILGDILLPPWKELSWKMANDSHGEDDQTAHRTYSCAHRSLDRVIGRFDEGIL